MTEEGASKPGWRDYIAIAIAAIETVFLPLVILIIILIVIVLLVGSHLASIAVFFEKSML